MRQELRDLGLSCELMLWYDRIISLQSLKVLQTRAKYNFLERIKRSEVEQEARRELAILV